MTRCSSSFATLLLVGVLSGCAASPPPVAVAERPMPAVTSSAAEASVIVVPDCADLVPIETARSLFDPAAELLVDLSPATYDFSFDPMTTPLFLAAEQSRLCTWGLPDAIDSFAVRVAVLADDELLALTDPLVAPDSLSVTSDGVRWLSTSTGSNLLFGSVWVGVPGEPGSFTDAIAEVVVKSLRTANPTLGL
jgi:hypothetical protein